MSDWMPTTYFPDLTELLGDTVTFSQTGPGPHFSVTIPRTDWEAMGRPGCVSYEPKPVIAADLMEAARPEGLTR